MRRERLSPGARGGCGAEPGGRWAIASTGHEGYKPAVPCASPPGGAQGRFPTRVGDRMVSFRHLYMLASFAALGLLVWACAAPQSAPPRVIAPGLVVEGGALGDECTVDADCRTGMCDRTIPGGYCTSECRRSEECGRGGWCDWHEPSGTGYCMQRCEAQRECRSREFQCFDTGDGEIGVCVFDTRALREAGPNIGAPCRADVECVPPAGLDGYCMAEIDLFGQPTGYTGGLCLALGCRSDAACGDGAACVGSGDARFCAPTCGADADCRTGYRCHEEGVCVR